MLEGVDAGDWRFTGIGFIPDAKLAFGADFSRRLMIVHLQAVGEWTFPSHIVQGGFVNVETQRRFVRVMERKLYDSAVGDDFVNCNVRWCRVERLTGAEGGNGYVHTFGGNPTDVLGEQAKISAADCDFFNADERGRCGWVMIENEAVHNATGEREVSSAKGAD